MGDQRFGRIVVLNGTASAGKSTLAHTYATLAGDSWVVLSQDDFAQRLVPEFVKVDGRFDGGRGEEGFHFVRDEVGLHVEAGPAGRRVLREYRLAVADAARAGNDVVVDECMFDPEGWDEWQETLAGLEVMWVRVECDLTICEAREKARADRRDLAGLARGQYERAHTGARYDVTVDLTDGDADGAARTLLATFV